MNVYSSVFDLHRSAIFSLMIACARGESHQFVEYVDQSASDFADIVQVVSRMEDKVAELSPKIKAGSTVMLVGDSLAVGMSEEFKNLATTSKYIPHVHAVGGTNTLQWKKWIIKDIEFHRPALVLISLGTNDTARLNFMKKTGAFRDLVQLVENSGAICVWIGPPAIKKQRLNRIEEVRSSIVEVAPNYFPSEKISIKLDDGIHPSPSGYRTWIRAVWQWLSAGNIIVSQN